MALEPETQAKEFDIETMVKLQRLAAVAPTVQLRRYAGGFLRLTWLLFFAGTGRHADKGA